ncbi:MAG: aminopeptidase [Treponema sp.]|jgi:predicted aminopeptidase|nr:aminopeptidase [Treponema sp.]
MNCISKTIILLPVFVTAILLLSVCALFSGCYTLKQGTIMLGYLGRAVPLESLLETDSGSENASTFQQDSTTETGKNRLFVERVQDIRRFATEELGLKMSKNYTRYVSIDRDYLAAVVSASAADSFTRHEWKYPVVGAMPYKGFFNAADARKERVKLEKKGLDVWIRGVDAFSTLGWFRDPLYSYMRDYSPYWLADLIIHESFHATVFLKGHVQFNEELAEFVGGEGGRLYMESRFGVDSEEYRAMIAGKEDSRRYVSFIQELIAELQTLYRGDADRDEKLKKKEMIIKDFQEQFDAKYENLFTSENFRGFSTMSPNNAYLELYRLYYTEDNFYADLYEKSGKNLSSFIAAAKTMPKKGLPGRERLTQALNSDDPLR